MPRLRLGLPLIALALVATGTPIFAQSAAPAPTPNDYGDPATWLCRPDREDACSLDLSTTVVAADGSTTVEEWTANPNATVDCFYVYPTVSGDPTGNSDTEAGPGENGVVRSQLARFASTCRVYAPLYRQVTLAALRARMSGSPMESDAGLAYDDVLAAWNHYLANDNDGRGVILIGHSQGTGVLVRLIAAEIDGEPVQDRIVSALLLGGSVAVPEGKDVGGSFDHMPLCRSADQIGCVITYMAFRSTLPPAQSFFGRAQGAGMMAGCTNPAALAGGSGELDAYHGNGGGGGIFAGQPTTWTEPASTIETEFVRTPGLVHGECVYEDGYSYLEVTVQGDPDDPRTDDIPGDLVIGGQASAVWGLHLVDVSIAMGNLLEIVERQAAAYVRR